MIPLDRVRAMLRLGSDAAQESWTWRYDDADGCRVIENPRARFEEERRIAEMCASSDADAALIAAAPDLAAQVLTLAAALETAERERDEARTDAARLRGEVEGAHRAASHARQERTVMAEELTTVREARDAARSAHAELAAAVATVRDARAVVAATSAQYNAAWDAASAPPTPSDCEAVAAALRASYEAGDALSAALDALLARCP